MASPSPSPLRWVGFPLKRSNGIKAVRLFADDRSPDIVLKTCVPTIPAHQCCLYML